VAGKKGEKAARERPSAPEAARLSVQLGMGGETVSDETLAAVKRVLSAIERSTVSQALLACNPGLNSRSFLSEGRGMERE
jgi:hypothetical protein